MPRACGASSTPRLLGPIAGVSGILGRPVEPGDDVTTKAHLHALAARFARALPKRVALERGGRRESRMRDAPAASRPKKVGHELFTTGTPEQSGPPCAIGFNGCFVLSLVIGLSCHHPRQDAKAFLAGLMPASRHQDHTTSPSAFAPLVRRRQGVHRIPRSTIVTTRPPLLMSAGRAKRNH